MVLTEVGLVGVLLFVVVVWALLEIVLWSVEIEVKIWV